MTYFLCAKDHYVQSHRGETLFTGGRCPARDCGSRLRPAPEGDLEAQRCPGCSKGLLLPTEVDGILVELCSFCGQSRLVRDEVNVPAAKTGAQRVAEHRARKQAAGAA